MKRIKPITSLVLSVTMLVVALLAIRPTGTFAQEPTSATRPRPASAWGRLPPTRTVEPGLLGVQTAGDETFYSPSHSAPLPAGAELVVLERRGGSSGWIHGRLRDGSTTWLPAANVEPIVPREP